MKETKFIECKKINFAKETDKSLRTFDKKFAVNMAPSIAEQGLIQPIAVWADPEVPGNYVGIDGKHRHHAVYKVLKQQLIECNVFDDMNEAEAHMASVAANLWRSNLSAAQYAASVKVWFDYYAAKNPEKVGSNRANPEDREAAFAAAAKAPESSAGHEGWTEVSGQSEVTAIMEPGSESKNFAETVAATTGQSLSSAERTQRIALAFDADQLATFDQMNTSKTDMLMIGKIKNKDKRAEVVNLVASGMEPSVASARIMGDQAPTRDNGNKNKAEKKAAAEAAKADVEPALSDEEWFTKECGDKASLIEIPDKYKSEAILYRKSNEARHVFRGKAKAALKDIKDSKMGGPLWSLMQRLTNLSHPKDWFLCVTCGGKCLTRPQENPNDNDALCPKCWGAGFQLKTENYL